MSWPLGDLVHVAPGACICDGVTVGAGARIGAGAVFYQLVTRVEAAPGTAVLEDLE